MNDYSSNVFSENRLLALCICAACGKRLKKDTKEPSEDLVYICENHIFLLCNLRFVSAARQPGQQGFDMILPSALSLTATRCSNPSETCGLRSLTLQQRSSQEGLRHQPAGLSRCSLPSSSLLTLQLLRSSGNVTRLIFNKNKLLSRHLISKSYLKIRIALFYDKLGFVVSLALCYSGQPCPCE